MVSSKSSILYNQVQQEHPLTKSRRPAPSFFILIAVFFYALLISGCGGINPLTGYDFTDATLAVDAPLAPKPAIITNSDYDILGVFEGSPESIFKATTAVVKESKAAKARRRLKRAAENTDVSLLIADGILDRAERYLNFEPVGLDESPDLLLFLKVNEHGIYSGPAYDGRTEFFLDAFVELIDDQTGEVLWEKNVSINEPISDHFFFSNIRSSNDLAKMSEEEMAEAMDRISDYTADSIVRILRREIAHAQK